MLLVLALAIGTGGYYFVHKRTESRRMRAVTEGWRQFDAAARTGDEPGMRAAVEAVLESDPTDALARRRRATLDSLEADPDDQPMVVLALKLNLRANRLEAAAREAEKRLAREPNDWLARCVRAGASLSRGDRATAERELDALPSPDDPRALLDPGGLMFAFQLFKRTDRNTAVLRALVQGRVVHILRAPDPQRWPPAEKIGLVECYSEGFEPAADQPQPPPLVEAWSPAAALVDSAVSEAIEKRDVKALTRAGRLGASLAFGLRQFRRHGQLSEAQVTELNRELEDRTRRAWEAVREQSPTNSEAYRGLAMSYLRENNYTKGRELTTQGLVTCGDDPDLAFLFSRMLQFEGRPLDAWRDLVAAARKYPNQSIWWILAIEAASVGGRRDLALAACSAFRKIEPANRWASRSEAILWLESGDARKALELLQPLGDTVLAADPPAARAFSWALAATGPADRVNQFLSVAESTAIRMESPVPVLAALRGWFDAPPDAARASTIGDHADRLIRDRWPDDPGLFRIRAEARTRAAELTPPGWDPIRVRDAVLAHERVRARFRDDADSATGLALLRLYGDNNPEQALRDLAPLLDQDDEPRLTMLQRELIGAAFRRAGRVDEAVRRLEQSVQLSGASAGCFIQLALTYHAQGKQGEARTALQAARIRSRSEREQADYVTAAKTLHP